MSTLEEREERLKQLTFDINGETSYDEEEILADLLKNTVLFCNDFPYAYSNKEPIELQPSTITLFVNCNDIFYWGSADSETITVEELPNLYKMWVKEPFWGVVKWACLKRNMRPQEPVLRDMKKLGLWDEELEALPWRDPKDGG